MSRITKAIAEEIAGKLLAKKREKNEKRYKEIQDIITAIQEAKVPLEVMKLFNDSKTKGYIECHDQVFINGPGLNYDRISLTRKVPEATGTYHPNIILDEATSLLVSKKLETYRKHVELNYDLEKKLTATLMALRTYNKVKSMFPEAAKYLPPVQSTCTEIQCISELVKELGTDE